MNQTIIGKVGGNAPSFRLARRRIPASVRFPGLVLLTLLSLIVAHSAMAAQANTAHFMVSVRVVHECEYEINGQSQNPSVIHVIMRGCTGQPGLVARGFAFSGEEKLTGRDATGYLLRETHNNISRSGNPYIEIDF